MTNRLLTKEELFAVLERAAADLRGGHEIAEDFHVSFEPRLPAAMRQTKQMTCLGCGSHVQPCCGH